MSLFINTQVMTCRSSEDDDFWSLYDDYRMEILELSEMVEDRKNDVLVLGDDLIRMYCGL